MENIRLYTDKYDEEFEPHLRSFTQGIWGLLMKVWSLPRTAVHWTVCMLCLWLFLCAFVLNEVSAFHAESMTTK